MSRLIASIWLNPIKPNNTADDGVVLFIDHRKFPFPELTTTTTLLVWLVNYCPANKRAVLPLYQGITNSRSSGSGRMLIERVRKSGSESGEGGGNHCFRTKILCLLDADWTHHLTLTSIERNSVTELWSVMVRLSLCFSLTHSYRTTKGMLFSISTKTTTFVNRRERGIFTGSGGRRRRIKRIFN